MAEKTGIHISKKILDALPAAERSLDPKDALWAKSNGKCYLCQGKLNRSSDYIVPDHDEPAGEDGPTTLANLNLAHSSCNSWKRNHSTAPAAAFLSFNRFISETGAPVVYRDCLPYFGIKPKSIHVTRHEGRVTLELPNGETQDAHIMSETNPSGKFEYCFAEVPVEALFNDDQCQPRTIKPKQVWAIYSDIQRNPLHEPPSCRIVAVAGDQQLLMFDGQHKTLASLLAGRKKIAVKIYLAMKPIDTRHLVNSIQAKIPKLPLSAMELMNKMGAEYQDRLADYTASRPESETSEAGFLKSLPADSRARGKQAFENACISTVWDEDGLNLKALVGDSTTASGAARLAEATAKAKLLKPLIRTKPLETTFESSDAVRAREVKIVTHILNRFVESGLIVPGEPVPPGAVEAVQRRKYQAALAYVAGLMRKVASHVLVVEEKDCLGEADPTTEQWKKLDEAIDRIVGHPVWTHPQTTQSVIDVILALQKNQDAEKAFRRVGLVIGYALTGDLDPEWAGPSIAS